MCVEREAGEWVPWSEGGGLGSGSLGLRKVELEGNDIGLYSRELQVIWLGTKNPETWQGTAGEIHWVLDVVALSVLLGLRSQTKRETVIVLLIPKGCQTGNMEPLAPGLAGIPAF